MRAALGLDQPFFVRFLLWLHQFFVNEPLNLLQTLTGYDFGDAHRARVLSWTTRSPVVDLIAQRLIAGGRVDGVYVGLPTMATADAAFTRKAGFAAALWRNDAATVQTVLAHGKANRRPPPELPTRAGEEEKGDDGAALDWFRRSTRRALLADLGVGTVDQGDAAKVRPARSNTEDDIDDTIPF